MTDNSGYLSAAENPALFEQAVAAALSDDAPAPSLPSIPDPPEGAIRLLVGTPEGVKDVVIQELNGLHEERLAKVDRMRSLGRWVQTLLECGVVRIGNEPATPKLLEELLIGDREYLLLQIRRATYGDDIEFGTLRCPECGEEYDLTVNLDEDVPIRQLEGDARFEVPLRKGGKALVRLPNGTDQLAFFEDPDLTPAARKSLMLSRCVLMIEDKDGNQQYVPGFESVVKALGIIDRDKILTEISKRQPGPRYDEITYKHECGQEEALVVGLMHLFPGV